MKTKYAHNAKTGEVFEYHEFSNGETDFPRGMLLAYDDYITTGFSSKQKAISWSQEWGCCDKCKGSSKPNEIGNCFRCGNPVHFHQTIVSV